MYDATFVSNGTTFVLGTDNNIVFDINDLSGNDVELGLSQGSSQVGQTVDRKAVSGNTITIKGVIYGDVQSGKMALRHAFAPFREGVLYFGDYYLNVVVKHSPTFSPIKNRGGFQMQLFAPYPFWRKTEPTVLEIDTENAPSSVYTLTNNGDIDVPYNKITIEETAPDSQDITITNTATNEYLKFNLELLPDQIIELYRDSNNVLRADLIENGVRTDILYAIDAGSTLWTVHVGDNPYSITSSNSGGYLQISIEINEVVGGVYET